MARRRLHDRYFKQAKEEGYFARSAYKLLEMQEKRRLIARGNRVLDLGCAPGSWLQVAAELVGPRGSVVGIDLTPVAQSIAPNARTLQADLTAINPAALLAETNGGRAFDVVLSDMAPATTGAGDHFRSVALCREVLGRLEGLLRPGGNLVMKVFEGEEYPALVRECGAVFERCKGFKPKACRDVSFEIYVIGEGYRPATRAGGES